MHISFLSSVFIFFRKIPHCGIAGSYYTSSQVALVVKKPPTNAGDIRDKGLIPGLGRSSGGRNSNPLQYSCLENPMDRGAWQTIVLADYSTESDIPEHTHTVVLALVF